ncbi:MAG: PfkB family carbohydrate kinase [Planctomycetota bacterium]
MDPQAPNAERRTDAAMPLLVTGTVGIDTIETPHDKRENILGGSSVYFAAAASFFTEVRMLAAAGEDFHDDFRQSLAQFPNICLKGLEVRQGSETFAWGGKYFDDWNTRETLFTKLGVLEEAPPTPPEEYRDSRFLFLANSHPSVQLSFLDAFPQLNFTVVDTMNLWIDIAKPELLQLLERVDGIVLNDEESEMLTGEPNIYKAGEKIINEMGPMFVVIKKGAHGCVLIHDQGIAALPAYPVKNVIDPTGAGDSFAGGMMGHLAAAHSKDNNVSIESIRQSLVHGTVIASYLIESFSLERVATLTRQEIAHRYEEFMEMIRVR